MDKIIEGFMRRYRDERELHDLSEDKLFESFAAYCLVSRFYENAFEPDTLRTGGPGDLGVDAAAVIVNGALFTDPQAIKDAIAGAGEINVHFVVIQARMNPIFSGATFATLASRLAHLFTETPLTLPCSEAIRHLRACIDVVYADMGLLQRGLPKLSVFYVAPGNPSATALEPSRAHAEKHLKGTGWFDDVEVQPVGTEALRDLYRRANTAASATITMTSHMIVPPMSEVEQAYMGILPAAEFVAKVLTNERGHIRRNLFHDNVRAFLQLRNPVNAEIQATLQDDSRRDRFAVMNNGITIVARALVVKGHEFQLRDFQIVNGCQTCYVLFFERARLFDSTSITVRIIVSQNRDAIADIVGATNRQTLVRASDFDARSKLHIDIEDYFAAQLPERRLFYERRSGQFRATGRIADDLTPNTGATGHEVQRTRIVTRAALARSFAAAFLDEPWRPYFSNTMPEKAIFGPSREPMPFYTSAAMLYRVEYLIRNRKIPSLYAPARFYLVSAAKYRLIGPGKLPSAAAARRSTCDKILDCMWDPDEAEALFQSLLPALRAARDTERPEAVAFDYSLLKTQGFGDQVRQLVLAMN